VRRLVLVSGAGRSGTSTVAGALSMLGVHLPQPEVPADDSNPRGFFESEWVVDFHKRLLHRLPVVRTLDSRPEALGLAQRRDEPDLHAELDSWLATLAEHDQVLVKDPRAFWFQHLWRAAAARAGAELVFVTMLRHPAEVARSRDMHYGTDRDESFRRQRVTANVAAWCNVAFVTEQVTRDAPRALVRYADLLTDWRAALAPVATRLDLRLDPAGEPAVDAFVDAGLRRSAPSWDDLDVPDGLRAIAEDTWGHMNALVADPADAAAREGLASLQRDYARLHDHAVAVALDHTGAREAHVRRTAKANLAREHEAVVAELEARIEELDGSEDRSWFGRRRS